MPEDNVLSGFKPGIYAIVELAFRNPEPEEQGLCQLFEPWIKLPNTEPNLAEETSAHRLVNLTRLRSPCVVVPDLANPNKRAYLRMVPVSQWPLHFDDYLEEPHKRYYDEDQFQYHI